MHLLRIIIVLWTFYTTLASVFGEIIQPKRPSEDLLENQAEKSNTLFKIKYKKSTSDFMNSQHFLNFSLHPSQNSLYSSYSKNFDRHVEQNETLPGINYFEIEMQVLLDSVLFEAIQNTGKNITDYVHIFFSTVNYMYSQSHPDDGTFPKLKVKVVRLEQLKSTMENAIFQPVDGDEILDIEKVLVYLRKLAKRGKFDKYDHTMLLTGRDLYRKVGDDYDPDVLGVAFLNGTCTKATDGKYNSLSVVEDVGAHFLGVYAAVHEIAHNLGAKHDSKTTSDYSCHAKRGYIMSPVTQRTSNMFKFSECSLESLRTFLFSNQGKCLAKQNVQKPTFPADSMKFPGDIYVMQNICELIAEIQYPNEVHSVVVNPGKSPSYLCKQISCKVILHGKTYLLEAPFAPGERMACGNNGKCVSGECVEKSMP